MSFMLITGGTLALIYMGSTYFNGLTAWRMIRDVLLIAAVALSARFLGPEAACAAIAFGLLVAICVEVGVSFVSNRRGEAASRRGAPSAQSFSRLCRRTLEQDGWQIRLTPTARIDFVAQKDKKEYAVLPIEHQNRLQRLLVGDLERLASNVRPVVIVMHGEVPMGLRTHLADRRLVLLSHLELGGLSEVVRPLRAKPAREAATVE